MEVENFKNINIETFEIIFKKYYSELCRFALKYTNRNEDAEEVVQDVFYKIWEKRFSVKVKVSVKSYLYISVRNKCLQNINHKKIIRVYEKHIEMQNNTETTNPHETLVFEESIDIFNEALNTLPDKCIEIFKLSRFKGLRYKEIAKEMSVSVKTVEANISKALKTFRIYFPEYALNK
ncbi:MAG: RNA polymerase sigma-70 factor [Bacteroidales bacterium]|nr:RNA polymerase sigma-70 factor [Bacteroidales bacterium]